MDIIASTQAALEACKTFTSTQWVFLVMGMALLLTDGALHVCLLFRIPSFICSLLARLTMPFGVNRSPLGYPALVHAAAQGYANVCAILLARGADVRLATTVGLVRCTDVAAEKCFDHADVRQVLEPFVREAKRKEDETEKARKAALLAAAEEVDETATSSASQFSGIVLERNSDSSCMRSWSHFGYGFGILSEVWGDTSNDRDDDGD